MKLTKNQINLFAYFSYYDHVSYNLGFSFLKHYFDENNVLFDEFSTNLNKLISYGLICEKNGWLYLTDLGKVFSYSVVFSTFSEYKKLIFDKLSNQDFDEIKEYNKFEITNDVFLKLKKRSKIEKEKLANSKANNKKLNNFTILGTIFFIVSMFFVGVFISKVRYQAVQDGFFMSFATILLLIAIVFYAFAFYTLKNGSFSYKILKNPVLLAILSTLTLFCLIYQIYLIIKFSVFYLLSLFILIMFALAFAFFAIYFVADKLLFFKYSTDKIVEKLYSAKLNKFILHIHPTIRNNIIYCFYICFIF